MPGTVAVPMPVVGRVTAAEVATGDSGRDSRCVSLTCHVGPRYSDEYFKRDNFSPKCYSSVK